MGILKEIQQLELPVHLGSFWGPRISSERRKRSLRVEGMTGIKQVKLFWWVLLQRPKKNMDILRKKEQKAVADDVEGSERHDNVIRDFSGTQNYPIIRRLKVPKSRA